MEENVSVRVFCECGEKLGEFVPNGDDHSGVSVKCHCGLVSEILNQVLSNVDQHGTIAEDGVWEWTAPALNWAQI
jgi:hypothetical protein